jgi:hypothetical protein
MPKKTSKKREPDEVTLRDVEREMAKPRIAKSARRAATADPSRLTPGNRAEYASARVSPEPESLSQPLTGNLSY